MADENTTERDRTRAARREESKTEGQRDETFSVQAQAEQSLTGSDEPTIVKTIPDDETGDELTKGPLKVNGTDGEEIEAANGLPYVGVSEDWVRLTPKD